MTIDELPLQIARSFRRSVYGPLVYITPMAKASAGLVMYRVRGGKLEVLLVHPGGPFWSKKDAGAWFIPKGEVAPGESELLAAQREFQEETGLKPEGPFVPLGSVKHKSGKTVTAWALEGDCDPASLRSNTFTLEWPPRSGKRREFPEVDRAAFFTVEEAKGKIHPDEFELIVRLQELLKKQPASSPSIHARLR
jgi:predicted NUDIX family NTP pyrophosphohydrolase